MSEYNPNRCPNTERCPLYARFVLGSTLRFWKERYCEAAAHDSCERLKRSSLGQVVPDTLLPDGASLS